jgi:glycine/D-amino acid oxidase-like deaminating enzyme/nitrite reductase/ring-hydroxylating ferredoxin subunit
MKPTSGSTLSLWAATEDTPSTSPLNRDARSNVCIVGAGIAGLTTAFLLTRAGKDVIILDDGPIGGGMTGRTTAHLSNALDDRFYELERLFGEAGSRQAAESHTAAIDQVEEIVQSEQIDCEFARVDGYLFIPPDGSLKVLEDELAATHRAGLTGVQRLDRAPLESFDTGPCLLFPRQAQFHPLKYLTGLAHAVEREGGQVFTGTHADQIEDGSSCSVTTTNGHTITADAVVVATNCPVNDLVAIHTKQAPYTTYVIGARVPRGSVPSILLWEAPQDLRDPYHYIRLAQGEAYDILIVGGEDHKTGQEHDGSERWGKLEQWTRDRFPIEEIEFRWSGQVMEPVDGLAFIGRNPGDENVFIATGDSGMGMTHGTIAGLLLTDLICGRSNPWIELYDPARKTLKAVKEFARENLNVAAQYADKLTPGEVDSVAEIAAGEGAVLRSGLKKVAVYRDDDGAIHSMSAACVHLGCIVTWNNAEKTWDCPCHGSRFDALGVVINGPANSDLPTEET